MPVDTSAPTQTSAPVSDVESHRIDPFTGDVPSGLTQWINSGGFLPGLVKGTLMTGGILPSPDVPLPNPMLPRSLEPPSALGQLAGKAANMVVNKIPGLGKLNAIYNVVKSAPTAAAPQPLPLDYANYMAHTPSPLDPVWMGGAGRSPLWGGAPEPQPAGPSEFSSLPGQLPLRPIRPDPTTIRVPAWKLQGIQVIPHEVPEFQSIPSETLPSGRSTTPKEWFEPIPPPGKGVPTTPTEPGDQVNGEWIPHTRTEWVRANRGYHSMVEKLKLVDPTTGRMSGLGEKMPQGLDNFAASAGRGNAAGLSPGEIDMVTNFIATHGRMPTASDMDFPVQHPTWKGANALK